MNSAIVSLLLSVCFVLALTQDPFSGPGPKLYNDCHANLKANNVGFPPPPNETIRKGQACDMFFKSLGILQDISPQLESAQFQPQPQNSQFPQPQPQPQPQQVSPQTQTATIHERFPNQHNLKRQSGFNTGFPSNAQFINQIQQYDKKICALFKQLGPSAVKGSLEQVCCDLSCYCQELESTSNSNTVCHGPVQWAIPTNIPPFPGVPLANNFGSLFPVPLNNQTNQQFPQFPPNGVPGGVPNGVPNGFF